MGKRGWFRWASAGIMCIYGDPGQFGGETQVRIDRRAFTGGEFAPETGFSAITPKGQFQKVFYETSQDSAWGLSPDGQRVGLHVEGSKLSGTAREDGVVKAMMIIMENYQPTTG
jgi:hypothetical protein